MRRIVALGGELGGSGKPEREVGSAEGNWRRHSELSRRVSVSRQPIRHPDVAIVFIRFDRDARGIGIPMGMDDAAFVFFMRAGGMLMAQWRLSKGEQHTHRQAQMDQEPHQPNDIAWRRRGDSSPHRHWCGCNGQIWRSSHLTAFCCNFTYSGFHKTVSRCPGEK